jgi:hypothetical protein
MNKLNVYRFWVTDVERTRQVLAPSAATEAAIARIERARAIPATVEEVDESRVDTAGFLIK